MTEGSGLNDANSAFKPRKGGSILVHEECSVKTCSNEPDLRL